MLSASSSLCADRLAVRRETPDRFQCELCTDFLGFFWDFNGAILGPNVQPDSERSLRRSPNGPPIEAFGSRDPSEALRQLPSLVRSELEKRVNSSHTHEIRRRTSSLNGGRQLQCTSAKAARTELPLLRRFEHLDWSVKAIHP